MISPGKKLGDMRPKIYHKCAQCKTRFSAIKTAKYCSNACRQKAKYWRSKAS